MLQEDTRLLVQIVELLADFKVKLGSELFEIVQQAIQSDAMNEAKLADLSSLLLFSSGSEGQKYISTECRAFLIERIEQKLTHGGVSEVVDERLALALP